MRARRLGRDLEKERFWREAVAEHSASELSVRAFCRQRQLTESAFYFWRRELKLREAGDELPQVEQQTRHAQREPRAMPNKPRALAGDMFVPVDVQDLTGTPGPVIEMILPSGAVLRVSAGDIGATTAWIAALEARLC